MSAIPSWRVGATVGARTPAFAPDAQAQPGLRADGRLGVHYALALARGEDAALKAALIGLEQTVELPRALLEADLAERMAGRVEDVRQTGPRAARVTLSYPVEAIGADLPQCLNLLFGNISLKPGIRIVGIDWPAALLDAMGRRLENFTRVETFGKIEMLTYARWCGWARRTAWSMRPG